MNYLETIGLVHIFIYCSVGLLFIWHHVLKGLRTTFKKEETHETSNIVRYM